MKKKIIAIALCAALAVGGVVAGSLAFLTDSTTEVKNTFTVGDIEIDLYEHDFEGKEDRDGVEYELIPGQTYTKDPVVTVETGKEECYLFVKVIETNSPDNYLEYELATEAEGTAWIKLDGVDNVYYQVVPADNGFTGYLITNNQIVVKSDLNRDDMTAAETNKPTLSFQAYAIQTANTGTDSGDVADVVNAKAAWDKLQTQITNDAANNG